MPSQEEIDAANQILSQIVPPPAPAPKLIPGSSTSEFKLLVGMGLTALVNPFLMRYLGVEISADKFMALASLAGAYLASRTFLKKFFS